MSGYTLTQQIRNSQGLPEDQDWLDQQGQTWRRCCTCAIWIVVSWRYPGRRLSCRWTCQPCLDNWWHRRWEVREYRAAGAAAYTAATASAASSATEQPMQTLEQPMLEQPTPWQPVQTLEQPMLEQPMPWMEQPMQPLPRLQQPMLLPSLMNQYAGHWRANSGAASSNSGAANAMAGAASAGAANAATVFLVPEPCEPASANSGAAKAGQNKIETWKVDEACKYQ